MIDSNVIPTRSNDIKYPEISLDQMFTSCVLIARTIFCKVLFEATHNWPACPFEEVSYLRDEHRHIFHITAYKPVTHSDRDVEFILLKHQIQKYLKEQYPTGQLGAKSCEMLAEELICAFDLSQCEVSEDDENGAVVSVTNI
jgi:hypothetical protein